jgi:type VI secretion system secreted protein VgrG
LAFTCDALGADALLAYRLHVTEELSRPFRCEIDLVSSDGKIDFASVVGQPATVKFLLSGLSLDDASPNDIRFYHGIVAAFEQRGSKGELFEYRALLVPAFWQLSLARDCRPFQDQTVTDIVKSLCQDHGFDDIEERLNESYENRLFCLQYSESAFDFASRLLEEEGICYFFSHDEEKHTLVLCDDITAHEPSEGYESIPFGKPRTQNISAFRIRQNLCSTEFTHGDFDFIKGAETGGLESTATCPVSQPVEGFSVYEYPGRYSGRVFDIEEGDQTILGDARAKARAAELHRRAREAMGETTSCRGLRAGATFEMTDHPREDWCGEYLLTRVELTALSDIGSSHSGKDDPLAFRCSFAAARLDPDTPEWTFRPRRLTPRPVIPGPQTAMVVGPASNEIWADEWGRICVHFYWDRRSLGDESDSCWVRVSQPWAGAGFGAFFLPRIGQEVVVAFLDGDPDRPLVVGSVYDGSNKPPYDLPDNATRTVLKTHSSPDGAEDNFNELRFEDKIGEEEIYLQAEKDMNILIKNDRVATVENDETFTVVNNRTGTVEGEETLTVTKDRTRTVTENETVTVEGDQEITVEGDQKITVEGDRDRSVDGDESIKVKGKRTIKVKKDLTETIKGKHSEKCSKTILFDAKTTLTLKVGGTSIELSKTGIVLTTGGSTIDMAAAEVKVESVSVALEGSAKIEVKGAMADLKADGIATVKGSMNMIG